MSELDRLYRVQEHDSTIDRLQHRRSSLPERATLARLDEALVALGRALQVNDEQATSLASEQARLEREVSACEVKRAELRKRIASGTVPRELQAWSSEEEALAARQSHLEDELLDVLERVEALEAEAVDLSARRDQVDVEAVATRGALAEAEVGIEAELADARSGRAAAAAEVSEALLARYDKQRARLAGVAVARLDHGRCSGCNLQLSTAAIEAIRHHPEDDFPECEECGRWLVR